MITVDLGDLCTHCGRSTQWRWSTSVDLFVNRIPSGADGTLILDGGEDDVEIPVTIEGYMCVDCQMIECDKCGEMVLDYDLTDGTVVCSECGKESK